jgi:MscS family membrane protein
MSTIRSFIALILLFSAFSGAGGNLAAAHAQSLAATAETAPAEPPLPEDPLDRGTPRSAVTALIRALAEREYALAGRYFALPEDNDDKGETLAAALQASLDAGGTLRSFSELSNDRSGRLDDGLASSVEQVGTLGGEEAAPILLTHEEGPDGQMIWRIAPETIASLDAESAGLEEVQAQESGLIIAGAPLLDWLTLLGVFVLLFVVFRVVSAAILWLYRAAVAEPKKHAAYRFLNAALPPFSLFLSVVAFRIWGSNAPVAIVARQTVLRYVGIAALLALAWFGLRLVDMIASTLTHRMEKAERRQAATVITLARRGVKVLLVFSAGVAILDTLGIDVTAGIAALGIVGIALALGAQKTVENLVGSVMVVADRPVQVGDFCRVGQVTGTIEDIGMRSTRIRTNDRTVVTIPNGDFSALQIENFSLRDRFLFNIVVGLDYALSPARLREAIAIIERVLEQTGYVRDDPRRAKLRDFGATSMEVEIFAYIEAADFAESAGRRQDLLMAIYEGLNAAGIGMAFPTQTIYLRPEGDAG